ncbi:hypothetical protein [Klebsiella phage vB_KpnM-VAC36]|nr:hypothetical protein [Klebsiella phage vB_KpnM-VAC36]WLJ69984.1 hypothetical protein BM7_CDS0055 [Klebsiella phage Kpn BM7]
MRCSAEASLSGSKEYKQVGYCRTQRTVGTAPSVPAFTYGPLTHLFRLPCNYLS